MTDLIKRLRFQAKSGIPDFTNSDLMDEAAAELERLEDGIRQWKIMRDELATAYNKLEQENRQLKKRLSYDD